MDRTTDTETVNFRLSHMDTEFASRSYDVFSCLDSIEAKHKAFEKNQFDDGSNLLKSDPTEEPGTSKTKFKIPKGKPWKSRLPDYKLRPDKWKTYSLLGVSPEQMSDKSNKRTALEFLDSLQKRGAGSSCPDATNQVDDDCMDTCTDSDAGQGSFASHKQHMFRKPTVQSLKQPKSDENQLAYEASAQMVDVGPNLWVQQTKDEHQEASSEDVNTNLGSDVDSSPDDTLHLSTKADSAEVHFQNKGLKGKSKRIRPRIVTEDDDDDSVALKDEHIQETRLMDDDESDEFSDDGKENSYGDEELLSELAESQHDMNNWSDLQSEEQGNSNDDDVYKRAEEFAVIDSSNSNSCFVLAQEEDIIRQNFEKDGFCIDDLDTVD